MFPKSFLWLLMNLICLCFCEFRAFIGCSFNSVNYSTFLLLYPGGPRLRSAIGDGAIGGF